MAAVHHHPAASGRLPGRTSLIALAATGVVLVAVALGHLLAADNAAFPAAPRLTATHARPAPSAPPLTGDWLPEDRRFLTAAADRVHRGGHNLNEMIVAAHQVCAMVRAGRELSAASAALVIGYGLSDAQAAAVGAAAVQEYCPDGKR